MLRHSIRYLDGQMYVECLFFERRDIKYEYKYIYFSFFFGHILQLESRQGLVKIANITFY